MSDFSTQCNCSTSSGNMFFQASTGISFTIKKTNGKVYAPNYKNIFKSDVPSVSGNSYLNFKDSYTNTSLLATTNQAIDSVTLQQLWEYSNSNLLWDEIKEQLSFQDIDVKETTLYDFVKDVDSFMVYSKLSKFGNVWWHGKAISDFEGDDSRSINVSVPNISGHGFGDKLATGVIKFWSPDKFINDELKKYYKNVITYNGVITSSDYNNNGWITLPDLTISTKPFEKLKIAQILLNLNYTYDPAEFGKYYTVDSTLATRIKDSTSDTVYDISQTKFNNNTVSCTDSIINHWIGGLTSTANINSIGSLGIYKSTGCENITGGNNDISHLIVGQISVNPQYNSSNKDVTNTIDPINWKSSELFNNNRNIGILNVGRAFGGASGNATAGVVIGGISKLETSSPKILNSVEIWENIGFLRNVGTQSNTNRCFHLQGGSGSSASVILGGYSDFNYNDLTQFSHYGKTGVKGNMEVFIKAQMPLISYFKNIQNVNLTVPRGDGAGTLDVVVNERQDKYDVKQSLKTFATTIDDEQMISEYVDKQSGTNNAKRYTIINIDGFIYGGNSSGNTYLTAKTRNNDILNSFEKISTIFINVGKSSATSETYSFNGSCLERVEDLIAVNCADSAGISLKLPKCGKYRIQYLSGAGRRGVI